MQRVPTSARGETQRSATLAASSAMVPHLTEAAKSSPGLRPLFGHVIDGSGSLTGATGVGTVSGFRSAALGGSVEYSVDLAIHRRRGGYGGGSPESAHGGWSGLAFGAAFGAQADLAVDVVLTGAPEDQRLRNVGFDDSVRYGIFRIGGIEADRALARRGHRARDSRLPDRQRAVHRLPRARLRRRRRPVLPLRGPHHPTVARLDADPRPARRDRRHGLVRRRPGPGTSAGAARRPRGIHATDVDPLAAALTGRAGGTGRPIFEGRLHV